MCTKPTILINFARIEKICKNKIFKSNLKLQAKYLQNASFGIRIATHPNVVKKNILSVLLLTVANVWQMWHLPALLCV